MCFYSTVPSDGERLGATHFEIESGRIILTTTLTLTMGSPDTNYHSRRSNVFFCKRYRFCPNPNKFAQKNFARG